jgi:osmotically-inducible protein OsmY
MTLQTKIAVIAASTALAAASLIGCNRAPEQTASNSSDNQTSQPAQGGNDYGSSSSSTESGSASGSAMGNSGMQGASGMASSADSSNASVAMADTSITAKIKAAYLNEPAFKSMGIHVETNNGVAVLTGTVNSQADADRAQQIASSIDGVKSVDNRLKVKSSKVG